jgi:hypothetical protein
MSFGFLGSSRTTTHVSTGTLTAHDPDGDAVTWHLVRGSGNGKGGEESTSSVGKIVLDPQTGEYAFQAENTRSSGGFFSFFSSSNHQTVSGTASFEIQAVDPDGEESIKFLNINVGRHGVTSATVDDHAAAPYWNINDEAVDNPDEITDHVIVNTDETGPNEETHVSREPQTDAHQATSGEETVHEEGAAQITTDQTDTDSPTVDSGETQTDHHELSALVAEETPLNFNLLTPVSNESPAAQVKGDTAHLNAADILDHPTEPGEPDVNDLLAQQPKTEPVVAPVDTSISEGSSADNHHDNYAPDTASLDAQLVDTDDTDLI